MLERRGYVTGAFIASSVLSETYGLDRGFLVYDDISELAASVRDRSPMQLDADSQRDAYRMGDEVVGAALSWLGSDAVAQGGSAATEAPFPLLRLGASL